MSDSSVNAGLAESAVHGVLWAVVSQLSIQAAQFVVTAILAHYLFPEDFGTVNIVIVFTVLVRMVNDLGLGAAIVQRKKVSEQHLFTSFWASFVANVILCAATVFLSPFIASFFHSNRVRLMLSAASLSFIIGAFGVIHSSLLNRELNFNLLALADLGASLAYGLSTIVLASLGFGVWSLVVGLISRDFIRIILLWMVCPWRPSLLFSLESFRELFSFGINSMGFNVINYLGANVDYLLVGRFLGPTALGYYALAYTLAIYPNTRVSAIITRVAFPAFSKIQTDDERSRRGYLKIIVSVSLFSFPLTSFLLAIAPQLIRTIYGLKWEPTIVLLQVLCLTGAIYALLTVAGTFILSKGHSGMLLKLSLIKAAALSLFILIGMRYGILGVAVAVSICSIFFMITFQWIVNSLIGLRARDYVLCLYPAILISIPIWVFVFGYSQIQKWVYQLPDVVSLLNSVIVGVFIYLLSFKVFKIKALDEVKVLLADLIKPSAWWRR